MSLFEKRPLALCSSALILASLLALAATLHRVSLLFLLIPALILFLVALPRLRKKTRGALLCVAVSLCLLVGILVQWLYASSLRLPLEKPKDSARLTATVEAHEAETTTYRLYTVRLEELDGDAIGLRLHLRLPKEVKDTVLSPGYRLTFTATPSADYTGDPYYYAKGLAGCLSLSELLDVTPGAPHGLSARMRALNSRLSDRLLLRLGPTEGSFLSALFLGNREALSPSVELAFRRTGLSHALALSGMHLTVLTLLLRRLLRLLGVPRPLSFSVLLLFVGFYTLLSGAPLSLLRAAAMLTIAELGTLFRLPPDPMTSLFFSVALLSLLSPGAIADLGLWLSFLATLGLLVAGELFTRRKRKRTGRTRILGAISDSLLFSLFALLFTLLLSAFAFGELSLISPLSNLLVSPLVDLLLILSPPLLLFGGGSFYTLAVKRLTRLVLSLVGWLSSLGGTYISVAYPLSLLAILAFSAYLAVLLVRRLPSAKAFLLRFTSAALLLTVTLLSCHLYGTRRDILLYIRHYKGEYLVLSSNGKTAVIDTAANEASLYTLRATLEDNYITEIDTLILPHCTEDCPAYLAALSERIRVAELLLTGDTADEAHGATRQRANEIGIPVTEAEASAILIVGAIELRLLSDLSSPYLAHPPLLLYAESRGKEALYASPSALRLLPEERRDALLSVAECLILGAYPEEEGTTKLPRLPSSLEHLAVASPSAVSLGPLSPGVRLSTSPGVFLYRFK